MVQSSEQLVVADSEHSTEGTCFVTVMLHHPCRHQPGNCKQTASAYVQLHAYAVAALCSIVDDACTEGEAAPRATPLTAAPIKGPLFDFLALDVDLAAAAPAAAALQSLAVALLQPAWADEEARSSGAPRPVVKSVMLLGVWLF